MVSITFTYLLDIIYEHPASIAPIPSHFTLTNLHPSRPSASQPLTRQPASGPTLDTHEALCTSRTSGYRVFGVTNTPELLNLPSEDSKRIHAMCVKGNKHSEDSGAMFALGCMCGNILRQSEDIVD